MPDMPTEGDIGAKVVLIEFSDYECPFCQRHASGVRREIQEHYVATGLILQAFANNPLPIHPDARFMATVAICADAQGYFWEIHDRLFESKAATRGTVMTLVEDLDFDRPTFESCLDESPLPAEIIDRDVKSALALGLTGTPGFAIGRIDSEGFVEVEVLISGAQAFSVFQAALDSML